VAMQLLVPLQTYPDGNLPALARHVTNLAKHLGSAIHVLVLNADFPLIGNPLANYVIDANGLIEDAKAQCRLRGDILLKEMKEAAEQDGILATYTQAEYYPAALNALIVTQSRYHDMTLVGLNGNDLTLRASAEEVLFGSGRPVVLIPEDRDPADLSHVAVAWDGSRVAARAVADALLLLHRAAKVTLLCLSDEKTLPDGDIGQMLVDYLAKHDIAATFLQIRTGNRPICETLQLHAIAGGAGLLVMGGFGHGRMRDFVLGGATTGVLADLRMPVLMSH